MRLNELLMSEFEQEMQNTRKMLERTPASKADWKPHEKSMPLGRLAGHIAELPFFGSAILSSEVLDLTPMAKGEFKKTISDSAAELLEVFEPRVAEVKTLLAQASDADLEKIWKMALNGKTLASMPRIAAFRSLFMNHLIHHRAQYGVYLRLNNIPLPEMYGPSADEGNRF
jgi:uncharacterized damage-inducible protein DinB